MTLLKHMPGDALRAMMEFDRCKADPIVWRSMVLAILLEREELLLRQASDSKWIVVGWCLTFVSWAAWGGIIYSLMVRS